jgi:hypothetical protein
MTARKSTRATNKKDEEVQEEERQERSLYNERGELRNPLWQSGNVSTNDPGPSTEDVSPLFSEARAQALRSAVDAVESDEPTPSNVVLPSSTDPKNDEEAVADLKDAADEAEADRDEKAETGGLIAETSDDSDEADSKDDADKADEAKKASGNHK